MIVVTVTLIIIAGIRTWNDLPAVFGSQERLLKQREKTKSSLDEIINMNTENIALMNTVFITLMSLMLLFNLFMATWVLTHVSLMIGILGLMCDLVMMVSVLMATRQVGSFIEALSLSLLQPLTGRTVVVGRMFSLIDLMVCICFIASLI